MSVDPVASTHYSDVEDPVSVTGQVDAAYDAALTGPGVNKPEQRTRIAEIKRLEAKGDQMTVSDQLRLLELKLEVGKASGTLTELEYTALSAQIQDAKDSLNTAMWTSTKDYNQVNDTVGKLEALGINTAGSPLETKRNTLIDGMVAFVENTQEAADFEAEQADSYPPGSKEREFHQTRADMMYQVTEYLHNNGGEVGLENIKDWESITGKDLRGVTSENLKAEASVFKGLAEERETQLRNQGLSEEEIQSDPLLAYYRMRESNANNAVEEIGIAEQSGKPQDMLNARMHYVSNVMEADKAYWVAMKIEAQSAENPDADFINHCDTQIKLYDERVGLVNEAWGKLLDMLVRAMTEAGNKA